MRGVLAILIFLVLLLAFLAPPAPSPPSPSEVFVPPAVDQYGGLKAMPSPNARTPFFRVEKFGNKWMFVTPDNNAFFMIGIYALDQSASTDNRGGNYYSRTAAKYGDNGPTWSSWQLRRIQSWGFNSVGAFQSYYTLPGWTSPIWPGDHHQPVKVPFIGLVRPAYYSMINQNNWAPQPVKNVLCGVSPYYKGWVPEIGPADYYDGNFDTFLANQLKNDEYDQAISKSSDKRYMIGMSADNSDELWGFGAGPDFTTAPEARHNTSHLGWLVLTLSPLQSANSQLHFVYADTQVYSKSALRDQLAAKYGTVAALNAAWGSNYTTFDSSGTPVKGEAIAAGNGATVSFGKTLAQAAVSKHSLQIKVADVLVAGDNGRGVIWGPHVSGTIDYASGALSLNFAAGYAPAANAVISASYVQNGWGVGSGLMDEDGRPTHRWIGTDPVYLSNTGSAVRADLDDFLFQIASHYFSVCRSKILSWMPGILFMGPTTLGTWSVPSNRHVLRAAAKYVDVMAMAGGEPLSQAMIDFIYTYYGDKPLFVGEYRTANADSAFFQYSAAVRQSDYFSQAARGAAYYKAVTAYPTIAYSANGSRPYVGVLWWQYLDNWGEKSNWGLVTLSDNAYDGHEAVTAKVSCSDPLGKFTCGGEVRDYGDVLASIKKAHQEVFHTLLAR